MSKPGWDLTAMREQSRFEVESYHKNNGNSATINNALYRAIKENVDVRKEIADRRIKEAEDKKRVIGEKRAEIQERYSYSEIQKRKFSRADAKLLMELQEEELRLNATISAESQRIVDLEQGGIAVFEGVKELRELAEESLMFGYPKDPRFQSNKSSENSLDNANDKLDFTNSDDRVQNYHHQYEWAQNLVKLAELLGPKVAKDISSLFDASIRNTTRQSSSAIQSKKEELQELLSKYGFNNLSTDEFRFNRDESVRIEDRQTTNMAVSAMASNSQEILRCATFSVVDRFLEWPEEDKKALKQKSKEPDYANQVCHAIDNIINSMGGVQGMEVPAEIIAKLEKLKAPYAKAVSKQDPDLRSQYEQALDAKESDAPVATEQNSEASPQVDISPKARALYQKWRETGTGLEFFPWCSENLPYEEFKDITKAELEGLLAEEREGVRQYHEQERQLAEDRMNEISTEARLYFNMWKDSGSQYEFRTWLVEEKKLSHEELQKITGEDKLIEEWIAGGKAYQDQQAQYAESLVGTIDPKAYAYYNAYVDSKTSIGFPQWCGEHGYEVPSGWEKVQEERFAAQSDYQRQQAKLAEENANSTTIDPRAFAYYDAYSKSGTPLGFVRWCEQKGLEVPSGWENIEKERLEGQKQYQQQASTMEDDDEMEM